MKTWNHPGVSGACSKQSAIAIVLFILTLETLMIGRTFAGSATWKTVPVDNNWNNPLNWIPETVPMSQGDVATFSVSLITEIKTSDGVSVGSIVFESDASVYTITPAAAGMAIFAPGIVNNSGVVQQLVASVDEVGIEPITFADTASVGGDILCLSRATSATNGDTGIVEFLNSASAGQGTYLNEGGVAADWVGGRTLFFGRTTADEATIICNGGMAPGAGGGIVEFVGGMCHAGNATLIANGGSNGGNGGQIIFDGASFGDLATVQVFGNATLSVVSEVNAFAIGSLEGDGTVLLGEKSFTIGGNNLSTTFSGVMQDGFPGPGPVTKIGSGTLTLSGANTFAKNTIISAGTLVVSNTTGSATGTGAMTVSGGTFGGSGIISGAVTVNSGAFLAPAHGSKVQATLTIQSGLTMNSGATYTYSFKAKGNKAKTDKVVANGVTINGGATLNLAGQTQGNLKRGLTLTVINNTSAGPISGTFSNLADGGIVTVNGNHLQANYEGGDGNDLTLTVVP